MPTRKGPSPPLFALKALTNARIARESALSTATTRLPCLAQITIRAALMKSTNGDNSASTTIPDDDGRLREWLGGRRNVVFAVLISFLLASPALFTGFWGDDHIFRLVFTDPVGAEAIKLHNDASPTGVFTFIDGDPVHAKETMDIGIGPWWTYPRIKSNFFRPVTWLTHWLDFTAWPESPFLMHIQSSIWYGLVVIAAGLFYRQTTKVAWVGGLAVMLFAIDDAHATTLGWISNRNALLAVFFGLMALLTHHYRREKACTISAVASPIFLLISLVSAEGGIATAAFLFSYELFLVRKSLLNKFIALIPAGIVILSWRLVWSSMGYGSEGMGLYADPASDPLRFAQSLILQAPLILLGQFAFPPPDLSIVLSSDYVTWIWRIAALFLTCGAILVLPMVRRDNVMRFWLLGTALTLIPCCATLASDRNLLFLGFGIMGIVAQFIGNVKTSTPPGVRPEKFTRIAVGFLWFMHGIFAPVMLSIRTVMPTGTKSVLAQLEVEIPLDSDIEDKTLVVVNGPSAFHIGWLPIMCQSAGYPVPKHTRGISPSMAAVTIKREDANTLVVQPEAGFLTHPGDQLFRGDQVPLALGDVVELADVAVEVSGIGENGKPSEATFRFDVPLEDDSLRWLYWKEGKFVPFPLPAVGQSVSLPAPIPTL